MQTFVRLLQIGVAGLTATLAVAACDAPWDGPTLPSGAHWIAYRALASGPQNCGAAETLAAGTTVEQVQEQVRAACHGRGCNAVAGCWPGLEVGSANVLVAVYTSFDLCGSRTTNGVAYAPGTLYFIHWVGRSGGQCPEMVPAPTFVLYAVAFRDVAYVQSLAVELQDQSPDHPPSITRTRVDLTS